MSRQDLLKLKRDNEAKLPVQYFRSMYFNVG